MAENVAGGTQDPDPFLMNAVTLAYIGDAVFELMVRKYILDEGIRPAEQLHKAATDMVNAMSQSEMALAVSEELGERERAVYRRAVNAHKPTTPRHQKLSDYRRATGIEAVFGYLFLKGDFERLKELFSRCIGIHFGSRGALRSG